MAGNKLFKLHSEQIVDLVSGYGGCIATDRITVDGEPLGYMYREEPHNELDSGWRFFAGTEDQAYLDNLAYSEVYDVNTIANYEPAIIAYLDYPVGSELERRVGSNKFDLLPG
ncbi:DUF2185 domain-containing protein [Hymenobacter sp. RP-2-7]|uniref:DUF2185 domain-containing protein n=1 Tax=Hymenobacter polaris TaxID=2682546 RepID=A0A7Y0AB87_9BACT|nr:DUF2185 domain-containing protein [Hymenobacter polaris]NML64179.1 DUF2185 domain-containing protein [Hymenobacter polaris]